MKDRSKEEKVVVTGVGTINAIGKDYDHFVHSLQRGEGGGKREENCERGAFPPVSFPLGEFSLKESLENSRKISGSLKERLYRSVLRAPLAVQTSALTLGEAWGRAGLEEKRVDSERVGLIVAGNNLTQNYQYGMISRFFKNPQALSPRYGSLFMDTDHVGTLSEIFPIRGEGMTMGGASASGNIGLIKGWQAIRSRWLDICVVLGPMADLSPVERQGFYNMGALGGEGYGNRPHEASRPFDKKSEGFIYGEGCACVILESLSSAGKRGVAPLVQFAGGAQTLDGNRLPNPDEAGEAAAMNKALRLSHMKPGDIDYLNAHGSSSSLGDKTEVAALHRVFGEKISSLWINSTKALTGHCLFSAGLVECVAVVGQMEKGFIHPNINLDEPLDGRCRFVGKESISTVIKGAMSNSFGFGGINTSVILKKIK